ncbi:retention module-containing protein, partial [Shewanella sp. 3_MG-2023]|uniref:retention module-containing protein n=1 Tax=Shewanella sp. 3_MG-2023 TaxID=3062635 RepID=UPI0026E44639
MSSVVTTKNGVLNSTNGEITLTLNNETKNILPGDTIPAGAELQVADGIAFVVTFDDGTILNGDNIAENLSAETIIDMTTDELTEIEALQALIESGEDPTAELPETAAGETATNQGGSDFASLAREGSETIATAGFDTSFDAPDILTASLSLGDDGVDALNNNFNVAQFTDNFVNGVSFTTSSGLSGFTGDLGSPGSFAYLPGDTITFMVGGVTIATFSADVIQGDILFLQDIAGTLLSDTNMDYVENMAIFLQALDNDLSDGIDDGILNTNSLVNIDDSYSTNINILLSVHEALANYIDPTTGQPLNIATAGKEMISQVLAELGIIFTRDTERQEDGQNVFETIAMEHVADTIDDIAGDRTPDEHDERTVDILDVPGGLITYNYNELDGQITFSANDLLEGAVGQQVIDQNLLVSNVRLSAAFEDIGTLQDLGDGNFVIILNEGITQYDLEGLSIDYRVEDWTVFRDVTSATQDQYKSHLSANIPDVFEDVGFNQFTLNSELTFETDQELFITFTSELLSEQLGYPIAEYADDYLVPLEYSNDGGLTWQTMTVGGIDSSGDLARPIFSFNLEAGNNSILIRVPIFDDAIIEPTEYFNAIVTGENVYDEELEFAIFDNDGNGSDLPVVDIDYAVVVEGMEFALFTLTLSEPSTETITLDYSSEELTALFGEDFTNVSGTVTFLPGETTAYISVPITDDLIVEGSPEFALINLSNPTNAVLGDTQATLRIYDNDLPDNTAIALDIDPVTGDNILTPDESTGTVTITGTVTADASITTGIIMLTINGQEYQAIMQSDGTFSVEVDAADLVNDVDTVIEGIVYGYGADGSKGTATATEDYDIPTEAQNDAIVIAEDTVAEGNVLDNDSDTDDVLSVVSFEVNGETYNAGDSVTLEEGVFVLNSDGSYSFTPNADWNGQVPVITYTTNTNVTATLTIEVTPVDDPAVIVNDYNTVAEDTVATGNVLDNDSDIDNDLTVTSFEINGETYPAGTEVSLDSGTIVISEDGTYTFTPAENWNGQVPVITYTTNTGDTATLTLEVAPVDDMAALENDSNTVAEDTVATGNVLDNDSDIDNDLTVTSFEINGESYPAGTEVSLDSGTIVTSEDGTYTFTPAENWNGQVPVITYTTNTGDTATLTLKVAPVDDMAALENDSNTVAEDTVATGNVLDNDSDIDNDLTVTSFEINGETYPAGTEVSLDSGTIGINEDGTYTFTPAENWNGQVPVITYTTNTGDTATLTLEVTPVDDMAALENDSNTVAEDTVATGNVLDNDSDIDNDLTVTSFEINGESYPGGTEVSLDSGTIVTSEDGTYTFTPAENWNGQVPVITYTTNTGDTATLTLEVTPVDDMAALENDSNTVAEDTVATGNVLDNDSDIDNDLTVTSFEINGETYPAGTEVSLDSGTIGINEDGTYTFTPAENWNGQVPVITYTTNTGDTATLTLEVTPVDDMAALENDSNTVAEDTVATGNVLDNDSDIDNDLTVTSFEINGETYPAGTEVSLDSGTIVINENGTYTFTPAENWNGQVPVITYTTNTGDTATLTLEVTPVDDMAALENDSNTVAEDTVATGNVLDNDSDIDNDLTVTSFEINGETYLAGTKVSLESGTIVINEGGTYTFTPADNWNGQVPVITYKTNTGDTATLTLEVTPINDSPIAVDDVINAQEDNLFTSTVDLDANDTDVDGDNLSVIAGTFTTVQGGTIIIAADGSYTYMPPADLNGVDSYVYTVTDGTDTDTATLTINVGAQNDAPDLVADVDSVDENTTVTADAANGVLSNDSDLDGDALSVTGVHSGVSGTNTAITAGQPGVIANEYGTLTINSDGSYTFIANGASSEALPDGVTANAVFTYTATDGTQSLTQTLTITITGANDP